MNLVIKRSVVAIAVCSLSTAAWAALFTYQPGDSGVTGPGVPLQIPDNNWSGVAYGFSFADASYSQITSVTVSLNISGGYNGDLYAYLSHGSDFAVLLNQVGATSGNPAGYANTGFNVVLTGGNSNPDIHFYQNYSPSYSSGQLQGNWQADGRLTYTDTTRANTLDVFDAEDPNGDWTLLFADRAGGDVSTLVGWSVNIAAVPEPVTPALLVLSAVGVLSKCVRWKRSQERTKR